MRELATWLADFRYFHVIKFSVEFSQTSHIAHENEWSPLSLFVPPLTVKCDFETFLELDLELLWMSLTMFMVTDGLRCSVGEPLLF